MNDLRIAAQQALEALEVATTPLTKDRQEVLRAQATLRAALAQQAEPTDPGHDVDVLREHVRHLERRVRELHAQQAEPVEPVAWRNAALRVGEDLCSVGPSGYYDMTAQQWLDWALSVVTVHNPQPVQEPVEPVEPVAWECKAEGLKALTQRQYDAQPPNIKRHYTRIAPPQRLPLTEEELLLAAGWERAEMYMKLVPNFPVDEAKQETLKNARAVEKAVWEKNHG